MSKKAKPNSQFLENVKFSFNFDRTKNIFILDRFKKIWMFWKPMSLSRSFLRFKSRRARLWFPWNYYRTSDIWGVFFTNLVLFFLIKWIFDFWNRWKNIFWCSKSFETFFLAPDRSLLSFPHLYDVPRGKRQMRARKRTKSGNVLGFLESNSYENRWKQLLPERVESRQSWA